MKSRVIRDRQGTQAIWLSEVALVLAASEEPPGLLPARQQMAVSLGWHIILACFGVAFPTIIYVMHRRGIVRDDPVALELAKRWSKVSAVLFAIGAVSGTVLSFEMGLLWPGLMGRFGDVLGLPFAFEGLSFFVEAIFLGIYLYGWKLRTRTLGVGIATGLIVFAGLYPISRDAPTLAAGLRSHASPLLAVAALAGVATVVLLYRRSYSVARFPAAAAVGAVITGWGVGQYPWMLVDEVTINDAAGADATLAGLLVVVGLAGVIVLPALGYLLWLTQTEEWTRA